MSHEVRDESLGDLLLPEKVREGVADGMKCLIYSVAKVCLETREPLTQSIASVAVLPR